MRRSFASIALAALALVLAGSSTARTSDTGQGGITYAIIGDTPYGASQLADFPRLASALNGDPDVELTVHLGDIKDGASPCSNAYFDQMRQLRHAGGSARRHAGGQRMDRLPPPGRGWLQPNRASRPVPGLLPSRQQEPRRDAESVEDPGPHARLRDVRGKPVVESEKGRLRNRARRRLEQRPRPMVRIGRDTSAAGRASRRVRRPTRATSPGSTAHSRSQTRRRRVASSWQCRQTCGSTRRSASRRSSSDSPTGRANSASPSYSSKAIRTASLSTSRS